MKKAINLSMVYAVAGLAAGVYFREFTKLKGFTGTTTLSFAHVHLLALGMLMFLLVALFERSMKLEEQKSFRFFMAAYNIGVVLASVMMLVRGTMEVLSVEISAGLNAALSGIAGIGHILTAVGMILFLLSLKKSVKE